MICPHCGFENSDDTVFCSNCGAKFEKQKRFKISKKAIIAISAVLVVALIGTVLFFVLRENPESNVVEALNKLRNQKQMDMEIHMDVDIHIGSQNNKMQIDMISKTDVTDLDNPMSAYEVNIDMGAQTMQTKSYYKDGYTYVQSGNAKTKTPLDYKEFQKQYMKSFENVVIDPEKEVSKADITRLDNGDIEAKFKIDGEDFKRAMSSVSSDMLGGMDLTLDDDSDYIAIFVIDENNTVKKMKLDFGISVNMTTAKIDMDYKAECIYNEIDDDFEIVFPDDLDEYVLEDSL